jgi:hypothetical protein
METNKSYADHQKRPQNGNTTGNAAEIKHIEVRKTVTYGLQ